METLRTTEELNNPDYNYYFAYSIDPTEKDAKKIEDAMAMRRNTYTQGTAIQRRLKDLYTDSVKIMTDKTLQEEEFQAAKKFKLEMVEKTITAIVRGHGSIYKSDFRKMADASGKWLMADEIEKKASYLLQQGVKIIDDTKRNLDFLGYSKIEKLLKTIGKNDLYDLLETPRNTPINVLLGAVSNTYSKAAGKIDYTSSNINQVSGEAKKIFKNDNSKKYYDIYLDTKDIWDEFALRRSVGITEMELKEFLDYSEKAKKELNTSDAEYIETLLAEGLSNFHITVTGRETHNTKISSIQHGKTIQNIENLLSQQSALITNIQAELNNLEILFQNQKAETLKLG